MSPSEQLYGLKIAQLAGRKTGVVYPILARLEGAGWVESDWEREERGERGPRRRFYEMTADGHAAARDLLAEQRRAAPERTWPPRARPARPIITAVPGRYGST